MNAPTQDGLQSRRLPRLAALVIFALALALYATTAVPGLVAEVGVTGDSAELQRAAYRLGVAHPTGYPVYTLIGYAAARLGEALGGNPYTWITYTSALAAALALVVFFTTALRLSNLPAALGATAVLAVSNRFWQIGTIPEVQALHLLILAGILALIVLHLEQPDRFALLGGLALLIGLGLAHHRSIIVILPAAALALILTRAWRVLTLRRVAILAVLFALPLLSYGYLFWRFTDPHVVYSSRPSWQPLSMTAGDVMDVILAAGQGGNVTLPLADFGARLAYVVENVAAELTLPGALAGGIGLALLAWRSRRVGIVLIVFGACWACFLMGWRLDWKGVVYFPPLLLPLALGLAALAAWPHWHPVKWLSGWKLSAVLALFGLALAGPALILYAENRPARDQSGDRRGDASLAKMATIPQGAVVYAGQWSPDTFILLEYLDLAGRQDVTPAWAPVPETFVPAALDPAQTVYLPTFDAFYDPDVLRFGFSPTAGAPRLRENGIALSGTATDLYVQARPWDDPRLRAEADRAEVIAWEVGPGLQLYSYTLETAPDGLHLTVYWRAAEPVGADYAIYTHLRQVGADGSLLRLLAQDDDSAPVEGTYPCSWWQPGQIVKDTYLIAWPAEPLPASGVTLTIGATLAATGERMQEWSLPLDSGLLQRVE